MKGLKNNHYFFFFKIKNQIFIKIFFLNLPTELFLVGVGNL